MRSGRPAYPRASASSPPAETHESTSLVCAGRPDLGASGERASHCALAPSFDDLSAAGSYPGRSRLLDTRRVLNEIPRGAPRRARSPLPEGVPTRAKPRLRRFSFCARRLSQPEASREHRPRGLPAAPQRESRSSGALYARGIAREPRGASRARPDPLQLRPLQCDPGGHLRWPARNRHGHGRSLRRSYPQLEL